MQFNVPVQDTNALSNLTNAAKGFFDCDVLPEIWFICGYTVATMHRQTAMKEEGFFPQLNVFGDAGSGKTIAAKVGASLAGMHHDEDVVTKFKDIDVYDRVSCLAGAVLLIDDLSLGDINDFIWSVSAGATWKVRGEAPLAPNANCIIISNQALGEDNPAIASRLLKLHIPARSVDASVLPALKEAMDEAVNGFSKLAPIQYDRSEIREIECILLKHHLVGGDSRIARSIALIVYFTQKFCDAAGLGDFSAFDYATTHLCPTCND